MSGQTAAEEGHTADTAADKAGGMDCNSVRRTVGADSRTEGDNYFVVGSYSAVGSYSVADSYYIEADNYSAGDSRYTVHYTAEDIRSVHYFGGNYYTADYSDCNYYSDSQTDCFAADFDLSSIDSLPDSI